LAGALLYDGKIRQVPQYFGLDCGMLEIFKYSTHQPSSKEQLFTISHFWSPGWQKRLRFVPLQPSAEEIGGMDFCMKTLRT
jgi:hypothetical protein